MIYLLLQRWTSLAGVTIRIKEGSQEMRRRVKRVVPGKNHHGALASLHTLTLLTTPFSPTHYYQ
jgi:hypothetical protein